MSLVEGLEFSEIFEITADKKDGAVMIRKIATTVLVFETHFMVRSPPNTKPKQSESPQRKRIT